MAKNSKVFLLINGGIAKIEDAYKLEIRMATAGHKTNAQETRANNLYHEGNRMIKEAYRLLGIDDEVREMPDHPGGNIRI